MDSEAITLVRREYHNISLKTFHKLARYADLRKKWGDLSAQTKENIFAYFQYLRGLTLIHDNDHYDDYDYWQDWFIKFMIDFDESNPYYDGNFEKVVLPLQNKQKQTDRYRVSAVFTDPSGQIHKYEGFYEDFSEADNAAKGLLLSKPFRNDDILNIRNKNNDIVKHFDIAALKK